MRFKYIDVTLTLDTSIYASGDVLADTQVVTNALLDLGVGAILRSIILIDKDDQGAALDIYLFDANVVMGTENSAPSITDANALSLLTRIQIATTDYTDLGGCRVAELHGLERALQGVTGTKDIYVAVVNGSGTPTYTATGMVLRLGVEW